VDSVKLGKNGQIAIPRAVLKRLALVGNETLLLDVTADGAIRLRPAALLPLEMYSNARIQEFEAATEVDDDTRRAVAERLSNDAR
jgi:AbrB family looped-hinge helix DNA binding protein